MSADRTVHTYRVILQLYPRSFRDRFEPELIAVFRAHRSATTPSPAFWCSIMWDVARSAPALRLEEAWAVWGRQTFMEGAAMLAMGMVAILMGGFEILGALGEWWIGGVVGHDGGALVGGAFGAVAGAILLAAGVALTRSDPGALRFARGAAITALVTFAVLSVVNPVLSIFARLVGVLVPIAVLFVTMRAQRQTVAV